jgi:hypothetical protein
LGVTAGLAADRTSMTGLVAGMQFFETSTSILYVYNGTSWVNANPWANFLYVRDEKASGTQGGTFTSGSWIQRNLNTLVTNNIVNASVASDRVTLPAGTFFFEGYCPALNCDHHRAAIYNFTDSTFSLYGGNGSWSTSSTVNDSSTAQVCGTVTIASSKTFELRHRCATTRATNGLGYAPGWGVPEIYAELKVWQLS